MIRPIGLMLLVSMLISCMEDSNPSASEPVIYNTHYDISGKEIDAPNACHNSVVRISSLAVLDSFISQWTIATDKFKLDSVDFGSRELLGVVTRRISHAPAYAKILGFEEFADSLLVTLASGCDNCTLDSPSGDVLLASFPKSSKPMKAIFNGKPVSTQAAIKKFENSPDCFSED